MSAGPASVPALLDRRLLFVTGKGGVGKSTVTAAIALLAAEQGKSVLLVEVDAKGNLTNLFEHEPVGFDPVSVYPGVYAMQLRTEASLREYLKLNLKIPVVGRIGPLANAFDFVANAAPGVKEILTVGKVCWEVRESLEGRANWDLVVVDAAATGHVLAQLDAPRTIRELVHTGPIRSQTEWMLEILSDPALTALNVVTAPRGRYSARCSHVQRREGRVREDLEHPFGVTPDRGRYAQAREWSADHQIAHVSGCGGVDHHQIPVGTSLERLRTSQHTLPTVRICFTPGQRRWLRSRTRSTSGRSARLRGS